MKFTAAISALLLACAENGAAFSPATKALRSHDTFMPKRQGQVALHMTPPTMIISPMIKKWREDRAKKNMPMASEQELAQEAPGLKVGVNAWKWPPVWPYDDDFFNRVGDETVDPAAANNMASMMGSMPGSAAPMLPEAPTPGKELDSVAYWSVEKAEVLTAIDEGAATSIRK
jgi:hypothetical protein